MFKVNDYVKRPTSSPYVGAVFEDDPPFEYGRIRIVYAHATGTYLVYWFGMDGPNPTGWTLKLAHLRRILPATEQEYFKHCLQYGVKSKS